MDKSTRQLVSGATELSRFGSKQVAFGSERNHLMSRVMSEVVSDLDARWKRKKKMQVRRERLKYARGGDSE